eukprot:128470_1
MSDEDANRFFDAVDKMLEAKSGVHGSSEFFRCASYHGEPPPIHCHHGRETFPGWHRIYLMDFENALQTADRALGRDGNVSLPYWDWAVNPQDGIPKIVRERFTGWPDDFWPDSLKSNARTQGLTRNDDRGVANQLRSWRVAEQARDCLLASQHWAHASTRHSGTYPSIEAPHNSVHTIAGGSGGQMGSVAWAAYDIVFWLHHCNVDRIYESYLRIEPDSAQEFERFQDTQKVDMFEADFEPFKKANGAAYTAKDTFSTEALGYEYDRLDREPAQQLRQAPSLILFSQVKVYEFESKCYQIHAWIVEKGKEEEFKVAETVDDIDYDSANYCGGAGIFGRGMECQNCVNRPPQDIVIDITSALNALAVSRYAVKPIIRVLETTDDDAGLKPLSDTPLPSPVIVGPLFRNVDGAEVLDQEDKKSNDENEVMALQRFLQKFGYYGAERKIDGDYGDYTAQAVSDYQTATGALEVTGVADAATRKAILGNKRCENIDPFAANDVVDKECDGAFGYAKKDLSYFVGVSPGYLMREDVVRVIGKACAEYSAKVNGLSFSFCGEQSAADIKFSFVMFNKEEDVLRFDGAGGVLGRGGNGYVHFDLAERWSVDDENLSDLYDPKTWRRGQPVLSLYYTALHELGR